MNPRCSLASWSAARQRRFSVKIARQQRTGAISPEHPSAHRNGERDRPRRTYQFLRSSLAFWSAIPRCETAFEDQPIPKAPEDWRTPKPGGLPGSPRKRDSVPEWGAIAPLSLRSEILYKRSSEWLPGKSGADAPHSKTLLTSLLAT